jgi:hypothetical protein
MQYREFGKTGVKVSRLGFGAMRLPKDEQQAIMVLIRALELGVNYIDTAPGYMDGDSEKFVGKALKGYRERVVLSTKNPIEDASGDNWLRRLEKSLKRLDVDYIDFYHMWSISWQVYQEKIARKHGPLWAAQKALAQGLIKHLSFSFHDRPENMIKIIDTGNFETVLCQYNLLDRANEKAMAYAKAKGLGVAIMGPVGGGRLAAASQEIASLIPSGVKSTPEAALRFVLSNPNVDLALSGMGSIQMVEENVEVASREIPLTAQERASIIAMTEANQKLRALYCTGCKYCMPCPRGVNIPRNFELMNYHRVWGLTDYAKEQYQALSPIQKAEHCIGCRRCEKKCPQKLSIASKLKEVVQALDPSEVCKAR